MPDIRFDVMDAPGRRVVADRTPFTIGRRSGNTPGTGTDS